MTYPVFDIIMPCYNSAAYVRNAIDSLLLQQYPNWNLIAVNDGSTDDTLEILNEYASNDCRVKVFSKENGGYATAVNYGLNKISGDYFLMLGSDDQLAQCALKDIFDSLNNSFPDVIAFRAIKVFENHRELDGVTNFDSFVSEHDTNIKGFAEKYPQNVKILFERDTAKCFKREILGDLRYFGFSGHDSDGIFSTLFVRKCKSFMAVPIDGYYWTIRKDSVSATASEKKNWDRLENWIEYYNVTKGYKEDDLTYFECKYIYNLFKVESIVLSQSRSISIKKMKRILLAHKAFIEAIKKYSTINRESTGRLDDFLFMRMPFVWCIRYRLICRKNYRLEL